MTDTRTFDERHAEVNELTRGWRLGGAYRAALQLRRDFPQEQAAHTLFHLIVCLTDNQAGVSGGMRYVSDRLIDEAIRTVPGFENSMAHGDMLRDQLLGLIRFPLMDPTLDLARTLPARIENLHSGDANRLACLTDARARLRAAEGDLDDACLLHSTAHQEWEGLPEGQADASWVHFNLVHWLRTAIELWGSRSAQAKRVMNLLAAESKRAPGAHGNLQIRIIRTPLVGLSAYRWLETHRMSRP
jgi:hypothetical protein